MQNGHDPSRCWRWHLIRVERNQSLMSLLSKCTDTFLETEKAVLFPRPDGPKLRAETRHLNPKTEREKRWCGFCCSQRGRRKVEFFHCTVPLSKRSRILGADAIANVRSTSRTRISPFDKKAMAVSTSSQEEHRLSSLGYSSTSQTQPKSTHIEAFTFSPLTPHAYLLSLTRLHQHGSLTS